MIKSCEDVKTQNDFHEFSQYSIRTADMGLRETADIIRWAHNCFIHPKLFTNLFVKDLMTKE